MSALKKHITLIDVQHMRALSKNYEPNLWKLCFKLMHTPNIKWMDGNIIMSSLRLVNFPIYISRSNTSVFVICFGNIYLYNALSMMFPIDNLKKFHVYYLKLFMSRSSSQSVSLSKLYSCDSIASKKDIKLFSRKHNCSSYFFLI